MSYVTKRIDNIYFHFLTRLFKASLQDTPKFSTQIKLKSC